MKNLKPSLLLLLCLPFFVNAQRAAFNVTQSIQFNRSILPQPWTLGLMATYDAKTKPLVYTASINQVNVSKRYNTSNSRPIASFQTDSTFGMHFSSQQFSEIDGRLGILFKKPIGQLEILAGIEALLGKTFARFQEIEALYIADGNGGYINEHLHGNASSTNHGPTKTEQTMAEGHFLKYGISPQLGVRYQPSKRVSLFATLSTDWAKRTSSTNLFSNSPFPVVGDREMKHYSRLQVKWGVGFRV